MSDALKLGLAGVGTVGSGLLRLLAARKRYQDEQELQKALLPEDKQ